MHRNYCHCISDILEAAQDVGQYMQNLSVCQIHKMFNKVLQSFMLFYL